MQNQIAFAALCALMSTAALAETGPTPEKVTVCAACHGANGKATQPIYPHLAGQYATYIEQALREYRAQVRKNPIMTPQAAALTDKDIEQLAEYYAAQPSVLHTPSIHVESAKQ